MSEEHDIRLRSKKEYLPKVSVITAVYNGGKYLEECIRSVLSQNYENFEYIIIDGGSTDGTVDIIKSYSDKVAYWISEPDQGIYDAWNKGLTIAKGEWISFVGADDLLYPGCIQMYVNHISCHPNRDKLEFISSQIELVEEDLTTLRIVGAAWKWESFKVNMTTWHVGCFHSVNLFEKYGAFDSSYKSSGDYELLLRPKNNLHTSFLNKVTAKMRVGGISSVNLYQAINETYKAKINNGILSPLKGEVLKLVDKVRITILNRL